MIAISENWNDPDVAQMIAISEIEMQTGSADGLVR